MSTSPASSAPTSPRLTSLSHGGGCGCKIAPGVLQKLLASSNMPAALFPDLLVGTETADDAAVYRINEHQAVVATTDFFMPIVDDPHDFGRIAATNAISDIYAMGATPLMALAIVGMPINVLPHEVIGQILAGGQSVCQDAGIPLAGGHSIDSVEPIYGLVVIGLVDPKDLKRNAAARAGDLMILGKPLGVGIYSAALKKDRLSDENYRRMVDACTRLNRPGTELARLPGVHALTDVTGFGLLGHSLEVARGANLTATIDSKAVPFLPDVQALAADGVFTGASGRNWASYGDGIELPASLEPAQRDLLRNLLTDPQTAGGLLVTCTPAARDEVLATFARHGFTDAAVIGQLHEGAGKVVVR